MKISRIALLTIALSLSFSIPYGLDAQEVHEADVAKYQWPTDEKVLEKLEEWRDLKFGTIIHFGLYSLAGVHESWVLDPSKTNRPEGSDYVEYKKWYFGLSNAFAPTEFDAEAWAQLASDAGMKYVLFTTKHHDGFCMYPSKYSDFGVAHGPFKDSPNMNITLKVLDAFRAKDFMPGIYFSTIDWHCEWFWNPYYSPYRSWQNYKIEEHPDWWAKYVEYAHNQMDELTSEYGPIDILWLDGSWSIGDSIDLDKALEKARSHQPGMIVVDRSTHGRNENYLTPEQKIPPTQLDVPWESCITLTNYWGWRPDNEYKSAREVINMIIEIVAKGGSLVLGLAPKGDGTFEDAAIERLKEIGAWLNTNGEAIYGTRNAEIYNDGKTWFTASKDGKTLYAIYSITEDETLPATIEWTGNVPVGKVVLLSTGKSVKFKTDGDKVSVTLPKGLVNEPVALQFEITK